MSIKAFFVDEHNRKKIDIFGDSLGEIESYIDLAILASKMNKFASRLVSLQKRQKKVSPIPERYGGAYFGVHASIKHVGRADNYLLLDRIN